MTGWLLDSDAIIAAVSRSDRISSRVVETVFVAGERRFVSVVSAYELAVKLGLGKLALPRRFTLDFLGAFEAAAADLEAEILDLNLRHAVRVRRLPQHHRDPFDRLLICQALEEGLTLVSGDRVFAAYEGVSVMSLR